MQDALRARLTTILRGHVQTPEEAPAAHQRVVLAQEVRNVQVETPEWCPPTSMVRITSTAQVAASKTIQTVRAMATGMVADQLASAAEALVLENQPNGTDFRVSAVTRQRMASELASRAKTILKQDVTGVQVIERIVAPVCDVTLSNEFVVNLTIAEGVPHI